VTTESTPAKGMRVPLVVITGMEGK
jgi:hypothetical protein